MHQISFLKINQLIKTLEFTTYSFFKKIRHLSFVNYKVMESKLVKLYQFD